MAELSRSFALGVDAANSISVEASDEMSLSETGWRKKTLRGRLATFGGRGRGAAGGGWTGC